MIDYANLMNVNIFISLESCPILKHKGVSRCNVSSWGDRLPEGLTLLLNSKGLTVMQSTNGNKEEKKKQKKTE